MVEPWLGGTLAWWNPGLIEPWHGGTLAWWNPGLVEPWLGRTLNKSLRFSTVQVGYSQFLYCYFQRSDFIAVPSE